MSDVAAMRLAVGDVRAIQAEFLAVSRRVDGDWRREMVTLRRRLQLAIASARDAIAAIGDDDPRTRALRDAFAHMRTRVALHQADWPAVAIDRDDVDYHRSVEDVRLASRDFFALFDELLRHPSDRH